MSAEEKDKIREDRVQKFEGLLHQLSQETTEFTNKKR
ncbi:hypothetical protein ID866_5669 [Astraeus odoratus]|nr:hypothetical protein ID866_5669 [Astraeus odoratus]